MIVPVSCLS